VTARSMHGPEDHRDRPPRRVGPGRAILPHSGCATELC
jgi:hypothetical protein